MRYWAVILLLIISPTTFAFADNISEGRWDFDFVSEPTISNEKRYCIRDEIVINEMQVKFLGPESNGTAKVRLNMINSDNTETELKHQEILS
jgi:hypothetical protein